MTAWPLPALRLTVGPLVLRPMTEADLDVLGALLSPDDEVNPGIPMPFGLPPREARAVLIRQQYYGHLAGWTPADWRLPMLITRDDEPLGYADLEAAHFAVRRTVETSSWLAEQHRGHGFGKLARTALLALAFDHLGAEVAETEAWHDNAASLGVSRALGYVDNGTTRHPRGGRADDMVRLRLDRERWVAAQRPPVQVSGLDACRHLFGADLP